MLEGHTRRCRRQRPRHASRTAESETGANHAVFRVGVSRTQTPSKGGASSFRRTEVDVRRERPLVQRGRPRDARHGKKGGRCRDRGSEQHRNRRLRASRPPSRGRRAPRVDSNGRGRPAGGAAGPRRPRAALTSVAACCLPLAAWGVMTGHKSHAGRGSKKSYWNSLPTASGGAGDVGDTTRGCRWVGESAVAPMRRVPRHCLCSTIYDTNF